MVMKTDLFISIILGFLIMLGMNIHSSPDFSDIGQATLEISSLEIAGDSIFASITGNVIVYVIVVGALYFFLRGIVKTFEKR